MTKEEIASAWRNGNPLYHLARRSLYKIREKKMRKRRDGSWEIWYVYVSLRAGEDWPVTSFERMEDMFDGFRLAAAEEIESPCDHLWHRNPVLTFPCPECGKEPG